MKIQIKKHIQPIEKESHLIEIRIEQEYEDKEQSIMYVNSLNKEIIISKLQAQDLSLDELYTLAYMEVLPEAIEIFKVTGYVEEEMNPQNFSIIESYVKEIAIEGPSQISKIISSDECKKYHATVLDQYGQKIKSIPINTDGVELKEGILEIREDKNQIIKLTATDGNLSKTLNVAVTVAEKELSETERLASMVTTLMMDNVEKAKQIETLVNQVTNIMLGGV